MTQYVAYFVDGSHTDFPSAQSLEDFVRNWQKHGYLFLEGRIYMFHAVLMVEKKINEI